jgi:hypothetical protein
VIRPESASSRRCARPSSWRVCASALAITLLLGGAARAEGPGIKLGEALVFHPGLALGVGYDTNVFYASGNPGDPTTGAAYIDLRPNLDLATLSTQRGGNTPHTLDFRLHLGSSMRFLLSGDPNINRHYGINLDGGFAFAILPFGNYGLDIFDNYVRTSTPPYSTTQTNSNINTDQNQVGLRLHLRPGGQRLEIAAQYMFGIYFFEGPPFNGANDLTNDFQLRASWKFFPKTALYLQASEQINTYVNNVAGTTPPTAYPFRVVLGVIGLITAKLSVNLNVGYGNSFTQSNVNQPMTGSYNNAVGLVELTWKPTLVTNLSLGYRHDFSQAVIGTYFDLDAAFVSLSQLIWRVTGLVRFGWERREYHGTLLPYGLANDDTNPRIDNLLVFHIELTLPIKDWLYISLGDDLQRNFSGCVFSGTTVNAPAACDYFRDDVWLRLGVAY